MFLAAKIQYERAGGRTGEREGKRATAQADGPKGRTERQHGRTDGTKEQDSERTRGRASEQKTTKQKRRRQDTAHKKDEWERKAKQKVWNQCGLPAIATVRLSDYCFLAESLNAQQSD